ncbi:histone-lysine N-methyltransferase set-1-like [Parambassis ranga]|uniref:Histone-lysine N-methyltransferase set-1-like n=1 Tax=Parambassis ranga TaxID=210632 RepID=A0A6P7HN71_9TELE|nr:histone-lysine N-methyltransferase set-1-like [Parambassis ranga]
MENNIRELTPEQEALEHIVANRDKPSLEKRFIDSFKGRGVFTHKPIKPSAFVVEYRGNCLHHKGTRAEDKGGDILNGFLYVFSWNGAQWSIDASKENRSLGRLVNDNHISPNCEMKKIVCDGKPHLCLFAIKEISPGEEITYNYGNFPYPWRSKEFCDGSSTSTPRDEKVEEDSAASTSKEASNDDDDIELPGPSSVDIITQLDFQDSLQFDASSMQLRTHSR